METSTRKQPVRSSSTSDVEDAKRLYTDIHDYLDTLTNFLKSVAEEEGELPPSAINFLSEYESYANDVANCSTHQDAITNTPTTATKIQSSEWRRSFSLSNSQPRRSQSAPAVLQMKDATNIIQFAQIEPTKMTIERVRASATFSSITSDVSDENNDQEFSTTGPSIRNLHKALFGTTDKKEIALIKQKMQAKPLEAANTENSVIQTNNIQEVLAHFTAWFFAIDDEPTEIRNATESQTETNSQLPIITTTTHAQIQPEIRSQVTSENQTIQSTLSSRTFSALVSWGFTNEKVSVEKLVTFPTPIFDNKFDFIANIISFTKNAAMSVDRWEKSKLPIM
ncbi:2570_t:CDS:2 [Ambispora gerdemannii]|uniref:2570_t:CDS:1 n=1 Tax=Ambispora gerdemannii TaxID=144530 RepID=A0A9N9GGT1_9GLOM|nr:2570_t:CDS:2 [Ambispora gerdemannii]